MNLNKSKKECNNHEHSPIKHLLHMILCCGLPIVIILALPFIARISPAVAGFLGVVAPFICPIMMGGMIFMMFSKKKASCCDETKTNESINEVSAK